MLKSENGSSDEPLEHSLNDADIDTTYFQRQQAEIHQSTMCDRGS